MQRVSIGRWAQHHWMVLFAVVVFAVARSAVYQLNGIFGSHDVASTSQQRGQRDRVVKP
jgi:hypothetical protein